MTRILAVADEVEESLYGGALGAIEPDAVVACGDLPFDYLEYIVTVLNVPLVYVPGNHDPDLVRKRRETEAQDVVSPFSFWPEEDEVAGPQGCTNIDGRVTEIAGLRVAGLGGSLRYTEGPNQYTQKQMRLRALRLELRSRRRVDVLVTHAPPLGVGDDDDPCHEGFAAFHGLVKRLSPRVLVHGHIHPYGVKAADRRLNGTNVVNAVGLRILEI